MKTIAARAIGCCFLLTMAFGQEQKAVLPAEPANAVPDLKIRFSCSPAKPGAIVASVSWTGAGPGAGIARVDVTAVRSGFASGQYATLSPLAANTKFVLRGESREAGLAAMGAGQGGYELQEFNAPVVEGGRFTLMIANVQPNLVYYWRVLSEHEAGWAPSQVVRATAPVCPVDIVTKRSK